MIGPEFRLHGGDVELNRSEDRTMNVKLKGDYRWCCVNYAVTLNCLQGTIAPTIPEIKSIEVANAFIGQNIDAICEQRESWSLAWGR